MSSGSYVLESLKWNKLTIFYNQLLLVPKMVRYSYDMILYILYIYKKRLKGKVARPPVRI
jgi:hypothetical protein